MTTFDTQDAAPVAAYKAGHRMGAAWLDHPQTRDSRVQRVQALAASFDTAQDDPESVWAWAREIYEAGTGLEFDHTECLEWWEQTGHYGKDLSLDVLRGFMEAVTE